MQNGQLGSNSGLTGVAHGLGLCSGAGLTDLNPQGNPIVVVLREYVAAKERFDNACEAFSKISQEKLEAETVLRALSEKVNAIVADGLFDPTVQRSAELANTQLKGFGGPKSY